ncbi:uncharacterized protein LOC143264143 [Megachile rotundata]|uniref:uncharacterized protein LOC143264143 n=1 Tax=Megachile rotundata TaxID=143995 RepID=UPI003FD394BA
MEVSSSSPDSNSNDKNLQSEVVDLEYKKKAVSFWKRGTKRALSFRTVQTRYKKLKSRRQLYEWEEQIKKGGSRFDKLKTIANATLQKFIEARQNKIIIHDMDLRRWAVIENQKENLQLEGFQASTFWLHNFKHKYNIVSRKTTKLITRHYSNNLNEINAAAENFVSNVKCYFETHGEKNIFNTDQSGFQLEMHSGRTLSQKGEKETAVLVQSVSATTHSYTIQPTILADGQLLSPLFIVLKEASGQLGPRVRQTVFTPPNVYIQASTSGKLTTELFKVWLKEVFLPHTPNNTILLLDSWSGYSEDIMQSATPEDKQLKVLKIPKNTTPIVQPLDVYGFRIWKSFARKISDLVISLNININLYARDNILKMQGLIHRQLQAPRYKSLFQYAWYRCGYTENRPQEFENPVEFCFTKLSTMKCDYCENVVIIRCSWCKEHLCFTL